MAFTVSSDNVNGVSRVILAGELDAAAAGEFRSMIEQAASGHPRKVALDLTDLTFMASAGLRVLVFARQKMGPTDIYVIGAHDAVLETIEMTGFQYSVIMVETYDPSVIEA
jgi:anti-anti-sigma factor